MTKKEALIMTRDMWEWIEYNIGSDYGVVELKSSWAIRKGLRLLNACPCCAYDEKTRSLGERVCSRCPLWDYDEIGYMCLRQESPYSRARDGRGIVGSVQAARDIVTMCRRKLDTME